MGRPKFLLSGGKEKTSRWGVRRVDLSLLFLFFFPPALRDFLIDFQGYVSNLFFSYGGLANESTSQCFSSILLNSARFTPLASDPAEPHSRPTSFPLPPPFCPFFLLSSKKKEGPKKKNSNKKKEKKKRKTYFQTGCLRWQHRSPATIKTFALPDRVLSIGLSTQQNESQVPVKMSSWAAFAAGLKNNNSAFLHS